MPDFIVTQSDFENQALSQSPIPNGFELRCRKKKSIFDTLNKGRRADGILLRIIRKSNGKMDVRVFKYFDNQNISNGFVILREVLEEQILQGIFDILNIYIYTKPTKSLIISGTDTPCGQDGNSDGGEGVKVRIPT